MYFRCLIPYFIVGSSAFVTGLLNAAENTDVPRLTALPNKCVALRHGRTCFAQITLRFTVLKPGRYCITKRNAKQPLYCESIDRYGLFNVEFQSKTKQAYVLVEQSTKQELATTVIDVAWVHQKTSRKRRWRLF